MPEVLQRPFEMFLEASLSAAILALIVLVIQVALRNRLSPAWRFALWTPVLLRLLLPILPESSLSLFNLPRWIAGWNPPEIAAIQPQPPEGHLLFEFDAPIGEGAVAAPQFIQADAAPDWRSVAAAVWLGGVVVLLARLGLGALWISIQIRRAGTAASPSVQKILSEAAALFEGRSRPNLVEAKFVESPALFGLFRPTLLVPPSLSSSLSGAEMRHVFLHELAHLKRRDLLLNWVMAVAQAVHWFNPVVWLVFRRMRLERELACDDMVLRVSSEPDPKSYGATILRLLEGVGPRPALSTLVGIAEEKQTATQRLKQIAAFKAGRRRYWIALPLLAAVIVAGLTNAQSPKETENPATDVELTAAKDAANSRRKTAALVQDSRLLMELGKSDEAKGKLLEALEIDPESRVTHYYLSLLEERDQRRIAQKDDLVEFLTNSTARWESDQWLFAQTDDQPKIIHPSPNPWARTNRVYESAARKKILRKLNEIKLERYEIHGLPLSEVVKDLARYTRDKDPERVGVNFIISSFTDKPGPWDYKVTIDPPLRNARLIDVLDAIVSVAKAPEGGSQNIGVKYSIEDYAVVFSQVPIANPNASRNRTHESPARKEILRKLNETKLQQYRVEGLPLLEVIKDLAMETRNDDPERVGVNFIISQQIPAELAEMEGLPKVGDFEITIDPPLRDVRLIDVLNTIVHVAVPPNGDRTAGLKYSIEDYAVVFSYHSPEAERLYTRTFRVDPNFFLPGIDPVFGNFDGELAKRDSQAIQNSVRNFFIATGIDFRTNTIAPANGRPMPPQKAVFYNHNNSVLLVRATLRDLDLIEKALQTLNIQPAQVTFSNAVIELERQEDLDEILKLLGNVQDRFSTALTTREFQEFKNELKRDGRFEFLHTPRITTVTGRAARIAIERENAEETFSIDIRCNYNEADKLLRLWAANYNPFTKKRGDVYSGKIYDGQTFFFFPQIDEGVSRSRHITFITAVVIDPAGNRVNTPEDFPLQAERTPPQN